MIWWNIVINIKSTLKPARIISLITLETPETGFHTIIEKRVTFGEIDDIDSYHVGEIVWIEHPKIEPLQIAASVGVIPDPNVVFDKGPLSHLVDVAAFKLGIEHNVVRLDLLAFVDSATHFERSS